MCLHGCLWFTYLIHICSYTWSNLFQRYMIFFTNSNQLIFKLGGSSPSYNDFSIIGPSLNLWSFEIAHTTLANFFFPFCLWQNETEVASWSTDIFKKIKLFTVFSFYLLWLLVYTIYNMYSGSDHAKDFILCKFLFLSSSLRTFFYFFKQMPDKICHEHHMYDHVMHVEYHLVCIYLFFLLYFWP